MTFKLAGYMLQTSFILIEDVLGDDFILGRSFLRRFDVLIDIRGKRLTIRDPHQEGARQELLQVKEDTPVAKAKVAKEIELPANSSAGGRIETYCRAKHVEQSSVVDSHIGC